ncbi:MAG: hypothetical protein IJM17_08770 [Firmicutes bacterium]|nr:hypothetical protein [Bacillota bacterium]
MKELQPRERFMLSVFVVAYVGLFTAVFFWEMVAASWACGTFGLSFRPVLACLTVVSIIIYVLRTNVMTPMDGFTAAAVVAASVSTFYMGGGTGEWLLSTRFLADLGAASIVLLAVMFTIFLYSSRRLKELRDEDFSEGGPEDGEDQNGKQE